MIDRLKLPATRYAVNSENEHKIVRDLQSQTVGTAFNMYCSVARDNIGTHVTLNSTIPCQRRFNRHAACTWNGPGIFTVPLESLTITS